MVDPILKWAGGKRQLLPIILSLFPVDYKTRGYHEPFVGGGAVFFKIRPRSGSINDINTRLMTFYRVVRDRPEELIQQASHYPYNEEAYYALRSRFNHPDTPPLEAAALLLYLNKTAYNGLYRVNAHGEFNVPFGRYKNPTIVSKQRIRAASKILQRVDLINADFAYVLDYARKGDLCYFDPPYHPVSETANFTAYAAEGFDLPEQERLRDVCVELDAAGVLFVLSNSYASPVQQLYRDIDAFHVITVQATRAISSKATTRGPVNELLVTNIPPHASSQQQLPLDAR
jgi:DNA adenine methylase